MDFNLILRDIAVDITAALLTVASGYVVFLLQRWQAYLKTKLNREELYFLEMLSSAAVTAAEQSGLAKLIANEGKAKKAYALKALSSSLQKYGLKVSAEQLDALLEEAVKRMNDDKQYLAPVA